MSRALGTLSVTSLSPWHHPHRDKGNPRNHLGILVSSFEQQTQRFQSSTRVRPCVWIFAGLLNSFLDHPSSEEIKPVQGEGLHQLYIFLRGNLCGPRGKRTSWITNVPISSPELPLITSTSWTQNWGTFLHSAHSRPEQVTTTTSSLIHVEFSSSCAHRQLLLVLYLSEFLRFSLKLKFTEFSKDMPIFLAKHAMFTESEHFTCFYGKI